MRFLAITTFAALASALPSAEPDPSPEPLPQAGAAAAGITPGTLASGPHKSGFWAEPSLPKHTIFAPIDLEKAGKLPVMIWGNGACSSNGTYFRRSLFELASHGFFAIANGAPTGGGGQTTSALQKASLKWISENAGKGKYANVDGTRIAVAGQSCGGLETYDVWSDPAVSVVGIFNSGEFGTSVKSTKITKPVFFFLGGSTDIAYANGERDYKNLPKETPKWKGNLPVGHMATWSTKNGGKFGIAEWKWLDWTLKGNKESGEFFTGKGAEADGWSVEKANMDKFTPKAPYGGAE